MINLEAEIKQMNLVILSKVDEIKKLMNCNQKSDGIAVYIEYLFGARDFATFIYRISVIRTISQI
jgi:peptidoglycan hydrolase CwlO-like protein